MFPHFDMDLNCKHWLLSDIYCLGTLVDKNKWIDLNHLKNKFHRWGRAGESTRSWFGSRSWCQCSREGSYKCMNLGRCWSRWLRCGRACCWCSSSSPGRRRGRPIRRGSCTARGPCTIRVCIPDIGRTDRRMVRSSRYRIWNKNNFDQNLSSLLKQKQSEVARS